MPKPPKTAWKKGERPVGRQKGTPNKVPAALKDMVLQALANMGGTAYLEIQAEKNPTAFLALVGKVLPLQIKEGGADPVVPTTVNHIHESKNP